MSEIYQGSASQAVRVADEVTVFRAAMRALAYDLRVAMPGVIRDFDPTTMRCAVELTVNDKMLLRNKWVDIKIPIIPDVLLTLPGDENWVLTFPNVVGSSCLVIFADMCINAWASTGQVPSNQEVDRRHDFSDGFAILRPFSKPEAVPNYSTTQVQLRSRDGNTTISLDEQSVELSATNVSLDGSLELSGIPLPTTSATPAFTLPVTIGGEQYYMLLKKTP